VCLQHCFRGTRFQCARYANGSFSILTQRQPYGHQKRSGLHISDSGCPLCSSVNSSIPTRRRRRRDIDLEVQWSWLEEEGFSPRLLQFFYVKNMILILRIEFTRSCTLNHVSPFQNYNCLLLLMNKKIHSLALPSPGLQVPIPRPALCSQPAGFLIAYRIIKHVNQNTEIQPGYQLASSTFSQIPI
jgi:hypothetical protein